MISDKRLDIQLLRAVAVLAVLIFHLNPEWLPGGYLGVDVFFVISGFLITGILMKTPSSGGLWTFYKRRINRLFPALWVVLFAVVVMTTLSMQPGDFLEAIEAVMYSAFQAGNLFFIQGQGYFDGDHATSPLLHTWSLGVEEQFYLLWAPLSLWILKLGNKHSRSKYHFLGWIVIIVGLSFLLDVILKFFDPTAAFYLPFSRSWELLLGAALAAANVSAKIQAAQIGKDNWKAWTIGFVLIIGTIILGRSGGWVDVASRILACAGCCFCLRSPIRLTKSFLRPLIYIGDISYSLYLWHWPVIIFAGVIGFQIGGLGVSLALFCLSIIFGSASYHLVEKSGLDRKSSTRFALVQIVGMLLLVGASEYLSNQRYATWRVEQTYPVPDRIDPRRNVDHLRKEGKTVAEALTQQPDKDRAILIGDSHAICYTPLIETWADSRGMEYELYQQPLSLSFSENLTYREIDPDESVSKNYSFEKRSRFLKQYLAKADDVTHIFVAQRTAYFFSESLPQERSKVLRGEITNRLHPKMDSASAYQKEFIAFADYVDSLDKKLILIGQAPPLKRLPNYSITWIDRFKKSAFRIPLKKYTNEDLVNNNDILKRLDVETAMYNELAKRENVWHINTRSILTTPVDKNGNLRYTDDDHVSPIGALALLDDLNAQVP